MESNENDCEYIYLVAMVTSQLGFI